MRLRTPKTIGKRWAHRVRCAGPEYKAGVSNPARGPAPAYLPNGERFAQRAEASQSAYVRGWTPYRDALAKLRLPRRGPIGSPQNIERCNRVIVCMVKVKARLDRERRKEKSRLAAKNSRG